MNKAELSQMLNTIDSKIQNDIALAIFDDQKEKITKVIQYGKETEEKKIEEGKAGEEAKKFLASLNEKANETKASYDKMIKIAKEWISTLKTDIEKLPEDENAADLDTTKKSAHLEEQIKHLSNFVEKLNSVVTSLDEFRSSIRKSDYKEGYENQREEQEKATSDKRDHIESNAKKLMKDMKTFESSLLTVPQKLKLAAITFLGVLSGFIIGPILGAFYGLTGGQEGPVGPVDADGALATAAIGAIAGLIAGPVVGGIYAYKYANNLFFSHNFSDPKKVSLIKGHKKESTPPLIKELQNFIEKAKKFKNEAQATPDVIRIKPQGPKP